MASLPSQVAERHPRHRGAFAPFRQYTVKPWNMPEMLVNPNLKKSIRVPNTGLTRNWLENRVYGPAKSAGCNSWSQGYMNLLGYYTLFSSMCYTIHMSG